MKTKIALGAALALLLALAAAAAGTEDKGTKRTLENRKVFPGQIACIGCTLKKRGADPQCTLHAKHAQGLLAADGTLWTFVDDARGHAVIRNKELKGAQVRIHGWTFPKAQYIQVSKFERRVGDAWVMYDYCTVCGFEEGDHDGSDLCEDCREDEE